MLARSVGVETPILSPLLPRLHVQARVSNPKSCYLGHGALHLPKEAAARLRLEQSKEKVGILGGFRALGLFQEMGFPIDSSLKSAFLCQARQKW